MPSHDIKTLRDRFKMSWADIARKTGLSLSAAQSRYYRQQIEHKLAHLERVKKPKGDTSQEAVRACLMCGNEFHSTWKGNRRCPVCDNTVKAGRWDHGLDVACDARVVR